MDAVAFPPPPPAPFLDDDFDFHDFTFASPAAPHPPPATDPAAFDDDWGDFVATSPLGSNPDGPAPPPTAKSTAWEKPRGPLPLSLFDADEEEDVVVADEGPAEPPPTAHPWAPHVSINGSKPANLKDLIAGFYGSQPLSSSDAAEAGTQEMVAENDGGFGDDDGWEFKAAPSSDGGEIGSGRAHGDGVEEGQDRPSVGGSHMSGVWGRNNRGKSYPCILQRGCIEPRTFGLVGRLLTTAPGLSFGSNQEDWSLFTSVDENLNHVQTTNHIETHESTGQSVKAFSRYSPHNAAILNLYKETQLVDAVHMTQSSSESVQSSSDMFSNNEMNSSFETDENHSIKSANDRILIDFYHKLVEESLTVISRYKKDLKDVLKSSMLSNGNREVSAIEREIQEICEKLQDSSVPKGFCVDEEHPAKDVGISKLLNGAKEDHLKDFEEEYYLTERIAMALKDMSSAVELYKHSISTLHTLEQASKEEQCDYVHAWYNMLLYCAQELQHGAVLWKESCQANVCDVVISQGGHCFIALGEIYRVAQILNLSLQSFKPWVLADPGMLSKMLVCWDGCMNAWISSLGTALRMVVDSSNLDAPVAKVLLESIININEIEVPNLQFFLPNSKVTCRLTLLPISLIPGMEMIIWDGDHYFIKVANLWANRISSNPPSFQSPMALK